MSKEKIEKLKAQLATEDNDLKAMGIASKLRREERDDRFTTHWLPIIEARCEVIFDSSMNKYTIQPTSKGIIDYYPKSNRLLIRTSNKWKSSGLVELLKILKLR